MLYQYAPEYCTEHQKNEWIDQHLICVANAGSVRDGGLPLIPAVPGRLRLPASLHLVGRTAADDVPGPILRLLPQNVQPTPRARQRPVKRDKWIIFVIGLHI